MSEVNHRTKEEVQEIAYERGLIAIEPLADELLLDLDEGMELNEEVLDTLAEADLLADHPTLTTVSANGNRHLYIKLAQGVLETGRIALQAALGSDPVKEALSIAHSLKHSFSIVLFETPQETARVMKWRRNAGAAER